MYFQTTLEQWIKRFLKYFAVVLVSFSLYCEAYYLDNNPYKHKQVLGPKGSYVVEWTVNWKDNSITFQVSAETKGWVGFGLSGDGRMVGSDVIVGGVSPSGKVYFNDGYVKGNRSVQIDKHEDWRLLGAWERGKRTYLSFTRAFDTCDLQDYPITADLIVLIWAYGEGDKVGYHMKRRGSYPVYLLDPEISTEIAHDHYRQIGPHSNTLLVQRWALTNTIKLQARPSSVWCSIHQGPSLVARHDIVGMGAFLPNHLARRHVHHMLIYRCVPPQQTVAKRFFEPYTETRGEECYLNENRGMPLAFCRELIYAWARGGKPFYFPEDIGIPLASGSQTEYFMLETHFQNDKSKRNVEFEAGVEIIFTHRQKPNEAGLLQIGYGPFGTFMIPPRSVMNIYGNCGPKCTSLMFPKHGVDIFAAMLHSHSLGRRIRLQHFRSGHELPWILKDDNYDSEFQQMRLLPKDITVLPGDHLTTQCTFDSHERNRTTFSGFSTQDENCVAFVYISRRIPFFRCTSEVPSEQMFSRYGVNNFTWDLNWHERYVTSPEKMEGTWLGDVVDDQSQWSHSSPEQMQQEIQSSQHLESCPSMDEMMASSHSKLFPTFTNDWGETKVLPVATSTPYLSSTVTYPQDVREYQDHPICQRDYSPSLNLPPEAIPLTVPIPRIPSPPAPPRVPKPIVDYSFLSKPLHLPGKGFVGGVQSEPRPQPFDLTHTFMNDDRSDGDSVIRIPVVQKKSPVYKSTTTESPLNIFHQLANIIHPTGKPNNYPSSPATENPLNLFLLPGFNLHNNLLKKRTLENSKLF